MAAINARGTLALIDAEGFVVAARSFRIGDPADLMQAVEFVNDGRRSNDHVTRYIDGEIVTLSHVAPPLKRPHYEGDCDLCDGWHPEGDHGSSNRSPNGRNGER